MLRKCACWVWLKLIIVFPAVLLLLLLLLQSVNRVRLFPPFSWRCGCDECPIIQAEKTGSGNYATRGAPRLDDLQWLLEQVRPVQRKLSGGAWQTPRKGINPRTRQQQLFDLRRCKNGFSATSLLSHHELHKIMRSSLSLSYHSSTWSGESQPLLFDDSWLQT